MFERFGICEILQSTRCQLVGTQVVNRDEGHRNTVDVEENVSRIGIFEVEPRSGRENVDSLGFSPELNHCIWLLEIRCRQTNSIDTKVHERRHRPIGIGWRGPHPHVEIFRLARMTMRCNRIAPDDQKPNVMSDE